MNDTPRGRRRAEDFIFAGLHVDTFNIAVFGPTGAGKSTLINEVFEEAVAPTGVGAPVTTVSRLYRLECSRLGIYDTRGLEAGDQLESALATLRDFIEEVQYGPVRDCIHTAWYCIPYPNHRITTSELTFVHELKQMQVPVIAVITKVPAAERQDPAVRQLIKAVEEGMGLSSDEIVTVNAKGDEWRKEPGEGIRRLLMATRRLAQQGIHNAEGDTPLRILAVPGIGADTPEKVRTFGPKIARALARTLTDATSTLHPACLHVTPVDYHELLRQERWNDERKEPESFDTKWTRSTRRWECTCCKGNKGRSKKGHLTKFVPRRAEDLALDRGGEAVKAWLRRPRYRQAILEHVTAQVLDSPDVVVAHSMGTLVALDLLSNWPNPQPPQLLITLGSPLSLDSVWSKLPKQNQAWIGQRHTDWLNIYDRRDYVTHNGSLRPDRFPDVVNVRVRNVRPGTQDRAHQVARYLSHGFLEPILRDYATGRLHAGKLRSEAITTLTGTTEHGSR